MERIRNTPCLVNCAAWIAIAYIIFIVSDYQRSWVQAEIPGTLSHAIHRQGTQFHLSDLKKTFDWSNLDGWPRPRFLSSFFSIIDAKLRMWLFDFVPPHPTISFSWLLYLIAGPWLFFQWAKRWTENLLAAQLGTILYVCSTGFLSGVAMRFHPAKPLTNLLIPFWLVGSTEIAKFSRAKCLVFYLTVLLGLFLDESALFGFALVACLTPDILRKKRITIPSAILIAIYFISLVTLIPWLIESLGYSKFDFFKLLSNDNPVPLQTHLTYLAINSINLGQSAFVLSSEWAPLWLTLPAAAACLGYLVYCYRRLSNEDRGKVKRNCLTIAVFLIFQNLLLNKLHHTIKSPFYYGNIFSLVLVLPICILISKSKISLVLRNSLFTYFLVVSILNFETHNSQFRVMFTNWAALKFNHRDFQKLEGTEPLTFRKSFDLWRGSYLKSTEEFRPSLPREAFWLVEEVKMLRRRRAY